MQINYLTFWYLNFSFIKTTHTNTQSLLPTVSLGITEDFKKSPLRDEKWPFWSPPKCGSNSTLPARNALQQPKNGHGVPKNLEKISLGLKWLFRKCQEILERYLTPFESKNCSNEAWLGLDPLRMDSEWFKNVFQNVFGSELVLKD